MCTDVRRRDGNALKLLVEQYMFNGTVFMLQWFKAVISGFTYLI